MCTLYETAAISEDIGLVTKTKVVDVTSSMHLDKGRAAALEEALVARSDRTFLWISLIVKMLEHSVDGMDEEFQEAFDTLPPDLDATYERIWNNFLKRDKAKRILHIVVAAARLLTLEEINIALAMRHGHQSKKDLKPYPLPNVGNSIEHPCGLSLLVIDEKKI